MNSRPSTASGAYPRVGEADNSSRTGGPGKKRCVTKEKDVRR